MNYKFSTDLPIEACKQRFSQDANTGLDAKFRLRGWKPTGPFIGQIYSQKFWLQQKNPRFNNPFHKAFYGEFKQLGSRTIIEGSFKVHSMLKTFMILWYCAIGYMGLMTLFATVLSFTGSAEVSGSPLLVFPLLFVFAVVPFIIQKTSQSGSKEYEQWVTRYMVEALGARVHSL